ncbi:DNA recombination protein RmuC [Candidatus Berkelbacteria bacterium]|nr:DNA recombination protein RmuC [Candidatus Berkelbacteria bacterium]
MELALIITIGLVGIGLGIGLALVLRRLREIEQARTGDQTSVLLNQNLQGLQARLDQNLQGMQQQLTSNTKAINERLDGAARVIQGVSRELGTMSQIGGQLAQFQDFLKSPKLRGGLGEQGLKDILSQALPAEMIRFQYRFATGDVVDAAIKIHAGIVPIDAKFPLENFNRFIKEPDEREKNNYANAFRRDFRAKIAEISKKYILPSEGTVDFALMYLPSESVYYELITNDKFRDLYDTASHEKVIVTSPSTFFHYLRTIMLGLEGQRMNRVAHQVLTAVRTIQQETHKFGDGIRVLGKHLGNAKNTMDSVTQDYDRLAQKVDIVMQIEEKEEPELLEPAPSEHVQS